MFFSPKYLVVHLVPPKSPLPKSSLLPSSLLPSSFLPLLGVLFTRLAVSQPRTGKFDDWGSAAYGRAGRIAVYIMVYGAIMGEPTVFQITCVEVCVYCVWGGGGVPGGQRDIGFVGEHLCVAQSLFRPTCPLHCIYTHDLFP